MKKIKALIRKAPPPKPAMKLRTYLTFLSHETATDQPGVRITAQRVTLGPFEIISVMGFEEPIIMSQDTSHIARGVWSGDRYDWTLFAEDGLPVGGVYSFYEMTLVREEAVDPYD